MILQTSNIPPRKTKKKHRIWPWIVMVLVFLGAALGGAYFASNSLLEKPTTNVKHEELLTAKDKATIMIMGVDERDDDVGRSDTLMIASIDPKTKQASLLSVPRDTRVKIKGHGFDKVNAAYAYGKQSLSQDTVENLLGVNIDHYIIINTKSFKKIIDAIGGIDIDVPKRMHYEDPWDDDGGLIIDFQPGMQHMDGAKAVTYVRYRDEEGDLGRIRRQQDFVRACMDKVLSPAIIPKLPSVVKEIMESIDTDLSLRQILEFVGTLKESKENGLKTDMVPGKPMYIDGVSYWIPNLNKLRMTVADTLGVSLSGRYKTKMEADIREYESSIPAGASEVPASDTSIGRARPSDSSKSRRREDKTDTDKRTGERETIDRSERSRTEERLERDTSETTRPSRRQSVPAADNAETSAPTPSAGVGKTR
ncbi:putative LytR family transcriptional regulator [Selenomonas ruminantium subsp. lactilytica TAM6421]|uniref:Putative LytR family transcriptional regulator n=1 Tax=Selenomonas ruminantium subsp. lactilytica (strain NBRC 103574 / TAM6421) TaxID=927704 RepID=I0GLV7_SELRL|nr:LCP family protein [Selenomonas ruminantium]BAL81744.1 putative LytR family transcriptional regulator [Selenomonas ruminantium subsp. lactilytica TAM6421]